MCTAGSCDVYRHSGSGESQSPSAGQHSPAEHIIREPRIYEASNDAPYFQLLQNAAVSNSSNL
jgi:hypothetical protein